MAAQRPASFLPYIACLALFEASLFLFRRFYWGHGLIRLGLLAAMLAFVLAIRQAGMMRPMPARRPRWSMLRPPGPAWLPALLLLSFVAVVSLSGDFPWGHGVVRVGMAAMVGVFALALWRAGRAARRLREGRVWQLLAAMVLVLLALQSVQTIVWAMAAATRTDRMRLDEGRTTWRAVQALRRGEDPYGSGVLIDSTAFRHRLAIREALGVGPRLPAAAVEPALQRYLARPDPRLRRLLLPRPAAGASLAARREVALMGYKYGPPPLLVTAALAPLVGSAAVPLADGLACLGLFAAVGLALLAAGAGAGGAIVAVVALMLDPFISYTNPWKERLVGGDSQARASVIRFLHGESDSRSRAMTAPVKVTRAEHTPQDLRRMAAGMKDAGQARRLQAISFVLDGWPRSRAAEFADVDRQTLRDWVERYNEGGVGALASLTSPGRRRLLTPKQDEELYRMVEQGPDLDKDGVVRWRRVDLVQQSAARFGVPEVHPSTMGKWLHRLRLTKLTTRPHHPKKDEAAQQAFKENFKDIVNEKLPAEVKENGTPVEFWFQDEARVGQQGTLSRVWAPIGSRPAMVRDNRRANAYIYGAMCPRRGIGAALVMASANTEAMNEHLKEISVQVATGAHAALICDGAGWHAKSKDIVVPSNITLITLPPYAPELNPMENVWEFLRDNRFGAQVWKTYGAIVRACSKAWNWFVADPHRIKTIGTREWVVL